MSEQRYFWLLESELKTWETDLESEAINRFPGSLQELHAKHERAVEAMLDPSLVQRARMKLVVSERIAAEALNSAGGGKKPSLSGVAERDPDILAYMDYWHRIEQSVYESAGSIDDFGLRYTDPDSGLARLQPRHIAQNSSRTPRIEYIDCQVEAEEWHVAAYAHQQSAGGTAVPVVDVPDISAAEVVGLLDNASRSYDRLLGCTNA